MKNARWTLAKFDSILMKYSSDRGLKINQVVVVARAGFTGEVISEAKRRNVLLLTLKAAMEADWNEFVSQKLQLVIPPRGAIVEVYPPLPSGISKVDLWNCVIACTYTGRRFGTPMDLARRALADAEFRDSVRIAASRLNGNSCRRIEKVVGRNFVIKIGEHDYEIARLIVHIHCTQARTTLVSQRYDSGDKAIDRHCGSAAGKRVEFVVPVADAPVQASLSVSDDTAYSPVSPAVVVGGNDCDGIESDHAHREIFQRLQVLFANMDVRLSAGEKVHDFSQGMDIYVDILACFYAGQHRTRTAILFLREKASANLEIIRLAHRQAEACEIDRLIIVGYEVVGEEIEAAVQKMERLRVVQNLPEGEREILQLLVPPLFTWSGLQMAGEMSLVAGSKDSRKDVSTKDRLCIPGGLNADLETSLLWVLECASNACRDLRIRELPHSHGLLENRLDFEFRLPKGSKVVIGDAWSTDIVSIRGCATVRSYATLADKSELTNNDGESCLSMSSSITGFEAVAVYHRFRRFDVTYRGVNFFDPACRTMSGNVGEHAFLQIVGLHDEHELATPDESGQPFLKLNWLAGKQRVVQTYVGSWASRGNSDQWWRSRPDGLAVAGH